MARACTASGAKAEGAPLPAASVRRLLRDRPLLGLPPGHDARTERRTVEESANIALNMLGKRDRLIDQGAL